ncbi:MAG: AAA family ATPase [Planctomycetota bacterium]|nr:AAA family ATPase [Planctomycetota bacterium]
MFTKLHLENFLSFRGPVDIPLRPLTVLVGANNAGKSNLLLAFRFLAGVAKRTAFSTVAEQLHRNLAELTCRNGASPAFTLGVFAQDTSHSGVPSGDVTYELRLRPGTPGIPLLLEREHFRAVDTSGAVVEKQGVDSSQRSESPCFGSAKPLISHFGNQLASIAYFKFSPSALRKPTAIVPNPVLGDDGAGLPAVLEYLRDEHPDRFQKIEEEFRHCVPEVERIQLRTTPSREKAVLLKERGCKEPFGAEEISDGLLLFLAILCCINEEPKPALLLLEEPEHGVHPRRLKDVVDLLYSLCEANGAEPPTQILLTTHSPYLLDQFKDDLGAVLVLEKGEQGSIVRTASEAIGKNGGLHGSPLGEVWYSGILGGVPA